MKNENGYAWGKYNALLNDREWLVKQKELMSDVQIAKLLDVSERRVREARKRHNVGRKEMPDTTPNKLTDRAWLAEQIRIRSDDDIAAELGVSTRKVQNARNRIGINRVAPKVKSDGRIKDPVWLAEQAKTLNDREIAELCGGTGHAVRFYRHKFGIPKYEPPAKPYAVRKSMAELVARYSDKEIAEMYGVTTGMIRMCRLRFGFPAFGSVMSVNLLRQWDATPPDSDPVVHEKQVLASCPRCKLTLGLVLFEVRPNRWTPEPNQKIRMTADHHLEHVGCGGIFRLSH